MENVVLLKILASKGANVDRNKVHSAVKELGYTNIKSINDFTPNGCKYNLIVWREDTNETLPDDDIINIVGQKGSVLYISPCPRCGRLVRRREHPKNPSLNCYSGCVTRHASRY